MNPIEQLRNAHGIRTTTTSEQECLTQFRLALFAQGIDSSGLFVTVKESDDVNNAFHVTVGYAEQEFVPSPTYEAQIEIDGYGRKGLCMFWVSYEEDDQFDSYYISGFKLFDEMWSDSVPMSESADKVNNLLTLSEIWMPTIDTHG